MGDLSPMLLLHLELYYCLLSNWACFLTSLVVVDCCLDTCLEERNHGNSTYNMFGFAVKRQEASCLTKSVIKTPT